MVKYGETQFSHTCSALKKVWVVVKELGANGSERENKQTHQWIYCSTNSFCFSYSIQQIAHLVTATCWGSLCPAPRLFPPQTLGAVWPPSTGGAQHPAPVAGGRDGGIISRVCGDDFRDRILHLDCVLGFDGRSVTLDLVDHILVFHLQVSLDPWPSMTSDPCKETITNIIYSIGATLNLQYTNKNKAQLLPARATIPRTTPH